MSFNGVVQPPQPSSFKSAQRSGKSAAAAAERGGAELTVDAPGGVLCRVYLLEAAAAGTPTTRALRLRGVEAEAEPEPVHVVRD